MKVPSHPLASGKDNGMDSRNGGLVFKTLVEKLFAGESATQRSGNVLTGYEGGLFF